MTVLKLADGWILTTEHSGSSYGIPVLLTPNGEAYFRHDILVGDDENLMSAAGIAAEKAAKAGLTQHKMVQAFILGRSAK